MKEGQDVKKRRKGRGWRRLGRTLLVFVLLFIAACFVVDHYMQFRKSDAELNAMYAEAHLPASLHYYTVQGRTMRYLRSGSDTLPALLFLHGSPGSISYYGRRLADSGIAGKFFVLAVDRPGYGYSGFGDPEPSIQKQAALIRPLLDSIEKVHHPIIVVGGSYGSSVACRLAMDYPQLVDALVLTGPSLGPGREKMFWFTPIIETPVFRWFIPRAFRSANSEKYHHREELEKMLPLWKNIHVPVMYLQGAKDNLIDTSNASFAREQLVNVPSLNIHFFPMREHLLAQYEWPTIRQAILDVSKKIE